MLWPWALGGSQRCGGHPGSWVDLLLLVQVMLPPSAVVLTPSRGQGFLDHGDLGQRVAGPPKLPRHESHPATPQLP